MTTAKPPPAQAHRLYLFNAPASAFEPLADVGNLPADINGAPCAYLWKDAIEAKRYVSRKKSLELDVTPARIDGWLRAFNLMKQQGVDVPVCLDHSDSARDCIGRIVDMQKRGERLYLLHQ